MTFHYQEPGAPLTPLFAVNAVTDRAPQASLSAENTTMPKKKKTRRTSPTEDTQNLYTRTYAARLAKQVADELDNSRRGRAPRKKTHRKA